MLVIGMIAVFALALLSAGLPNLRFAEPGSFIVPQSTPLPLPTVLPAESKSISVQRLLIIAALLTVAIAVLLILDKKARKLILRLLFYAALFLLASILVPRVAPPSPTTATPPPGAGAPADLQATAMPYVPPEIPWQAAFLVALLLVVIVLGVAYFFWRRRASSRSGAVSLSELGEIAQSALNEMTAGRDWSDAIIQCYLRMSEAVESKRGLYRKRGMTAAEFAVHLEGAGLPSAAVQRLTHLFEAARYGEMRATREEVDEAAGCLRTIVSACGGVG